MKKGNKIRLLVMLLAVGIVSYGVGTETVTAEEPQDFVTDDFLEDEDCEGENQWISENQPEEENWSDGGAELVTESPSDLNEFWEASDDTFSLNEEEEALVSKEDEKQSCSDGKNTVFWTLQPDGVLYIWGEGEMTDWKDETEVPWDSFRQEIEKVKIDEGVTSIGSYAFYECKNLQEIQTPESIVNIGVCAFYNCTGLETVSIG